MNDSNCKLCGKPIPTPTSKHVTCQKYCSRECQKRAANKRTVEQRNAQAIAATMDRARARARETGLDFCMNEADRLGMSYGQYMARRGQIGSHKKKLVAK